MKLLRKFTDETEARLAENLLRSHGVEAHVIGAKEYTSHVIGGTQGNYQLYTHPQDEPAAQAILANIQAVTLNSEPLLPNYFRKAIIYAFAAMVIFPLLFNVVSLINARAYWKHSDRGAGAILRLVLIGLAQLPGTGLALFFLVSVYYPDFRWVFPSRFVF
jgi:hypothetical protein